MSQYAHWYNWKDGLVHLGPESLDEDDDVFTLCSEEGHLMLLRWLDKLKDATKAPTCLQCIARQDDDV